MRGHQPLVGREPVMSELHGMLERTAGGAGGCVVLQGSAGIGKSRLLQAAASHAGTLGMAVAAGRATELDRIAPLTTLMTALRNTTPDPIEVAELIGQEGSRFWLVDRLGELIENHVRSRSMLVVVDDAHWTDELSALALRVLVPALSSSPVRWLLARRPAPERSSGQEAINWLIGEGVPVIHLDPLPDEAIAELCANALQARPDATMLTLAGRTGGNPLLLNELISALRDAGQVLIRDGVATVIAHELPSSFLSTVKQRLRGMSAPTQRLLDAGAVLGRPFSVQEVADLLSCPAVELVAAADEAMSAGLLVDCGVELAFGHDLVREAVYNNLSGPVRSVLHRAAATVTLVQGHSPMEIAEHLVRSGKDADEQVIVAMRTAANQIADNAPGTAADILLRTLRMLDHHDPTRPALAADTIRLLSAAGRLVEARQLGEQALQEALDPSDEAAILLGMAEALKHAGHNAEVVEYTQRGLAIEGAPPSRRAQLLAIQAHGLLYVNDTGGADLAGTEAARLGSATGEQSAVVFGLVARSVAARARAELDQAIAHAQQAVDIAERVGGDARHRHPRLWLARSLVAVDRFDEADAVYAAGQREADRLGTAWSQPLWHFYRAELRMVTGRLADAQAEAEAGIRVAERLGALQLSIPLLALLARVALQRDEPDATREHLHRTQPLVAEGISVGPGDLTFAVALLQESYNQPRAALESLSEVYQDSSCALQLLSTDAGAAATLVRIARRADAPAEAEAVAAAIRRLADRNPRVPSLLGAAAHAEGLLRSDLNRLRAAVGHLRGSRRPLALAAALEDTAVAEHAAGHTDQAVAELEEALDHWSGCDARRDVARVNRRLRALAGRRRDRGEQAVKGTTTGTLGSLTESELRVVRLVTQGLTNRETADRLFLSPHTVDSHLRHSFTKLGVNSRVELTRVFLEQE